MSERPLLNPAINEALQKYTMEIAHTAAASMWSRLGSPEIEDDGEGGSTLDLFAVHPRSVGKMVTGYAMEIDTSIADELLQAVADALATPTESNPS